MSKFTFFTILFSLTVIVIVSQLVLRDALFPKEFRADVLGSESQTEGVKPYISDLSNDEIPVLNRTSEFGTSEFDAIDAPSVFEPKPLPAPGDAASTGQLPFSGDAVLTRRMLQQVGFSFVSNKIFLGKVFDLFDITSQRVASVVSFELQEEGNIIGTAAELALPDEISAQETYRLIQNKTKVYVDLSVNETNQYGDRSFYINHQRKKDEVFLVIRIRDRLYALAYLKEYHPRVKTLITFLYTAILDRSD